MKRGKKMFIIILSTLGLLALITWGAIVYLGRSQTLSIKSIENPTGDLYLIHITKPSHQVWKAGAYAKFTLSDTSSTARKNEAKGEQTSRWLTIASTPDEDEILILTLLHLWKSRNSQQSAVILLFFSRQKSLIKKL